MLSRVESPDDNQQAAGAIATVAESERIGIGRANIRFCACVVTSVFVLIGLAVVLFAREPLGYQLERTESPAER